MTAKKQLPRRSTRKLVWWATGTLLLGLLPILSSLFVELIAPRLGCLVIEHGAYTMGPSFADDPGDLSPGCYLDGVEVGSALHAMHMAIFLFLLTWPALIASLFLWLNLMLSQLRRIRREM